MPAKFFKGAQERRGQIESVTRAIVGRNLRPGLARGESKQSGSAIEFIPPVAKKLFEGATLHPLALPGRHIAILESGRSKRRTLPGGKGAV